MRASERHSHPGETRWRHESGHETNESPQGILTRCRTQIEIQVRAWNHCEPGKGTHQPERPDKEHGMEIMWASEEHSPTGEPKQRDKSGNETNCEPERAHTCWGAQIER